MRTTDGTWRALGAVLIGGAMTCSGCDDILGVDFDDKHWRARGSPPVAEDVALTVVVGTTRNCGRLRTSDPDGDALTHRLIASSGEAVTSLRTRLGEVTLSDARAGTFQYSARDYTPETYEDEFAYQVNDGTQDARAIARVTIRVQPKGPLKLQLSDAPPAIRGTEGAFGRSIDVNGELAAIGDVPHSVYIVERLANGTWAFVDNRLDAPPSSNESTNFGAELALAGDWLLIGDYGNYETGIPGRAYLYHREESGKFRYQRTAQRPNPNTVGDAFGREVALGKLPECVGDDCFVAVVGAPGDDERARSAGALYVYALHGEDWGEPIKLTASDAAAWDSYGTEVAIDGDHIATVAPLRNHGTGAVYVFEREAAGVWRESREILAPAPSDEHPQLGHVAISGDRIVAGAPQANAMSGAAYVWERATAGGWIRQALERPAGLDSGEFGESVAIGGDTILVTAKNRAGFVYRKEPSGRWSLYRTLKENDVPLSAFGWDAAIDGLSVATVAAYEWGGGAAYFYNVPPWGSD